jgi:hypothetical protein
VTPITVARHDGVPDDETLDYIGKFKPELVPGIKAAQSAGKTSSEILDQFAGSTAAPPTNTATDFVKGLVGDTAQGLWATVKRAASGPKQGDTGDEVAYDVAGPLGPLIKDAINAHIATGEKALAAWRDPHTSVPEALGYTDATLLPIVGPAAADIGEKIGSGKVAEGLGDATALVLGGEASKLAGKVGGAAAAPLAENAESLYRSALKPSTKLEPAEAAEVVQTGLANRIPISEGGLQKLGALISELGAQVNARIAAGTRRGVTIDPAAAAQRADQVRSQFATQVNPTADVAAIDASKQEFLKQHTTPGKPPTTLYNANNQPMQVGGTPPSVNPIPADQAMSLVRGTYRKLGKSYGELKGAEIETQKALTRGIKEELQQQFPELKELTEKQWKFLQLEPELERAINRNANKEPVGLLPAMAIDTATTGGHAVVAGVLAKLVSSPRIRARLAMGLDMAAKAKGGAAAAQALPAATVEGRVISSNRRIDNFLAALNDASTPATGAR